MLDYIKKGKVEAKYKINENPIPKDRLLKLTAKKMKIWKEILLMPEEERIHSNRVA